MCQLGVEMLSEELDLQQLLEGGEGHPLPWWCRAARSTVWKLQFESVEVCLCRWHQQTIVWWMQWLEVMHSPAATPPPPASKSPTRLWSLCLLHPPFHSFSPLFSPSLNPVSSSSCCSISKPQTRRRSRIWIHCGIYRLRGLLGNSVNKRYP